MITIFGIVYSIWRRWRASQCESSLAMSMTRQHGIWCVKPSTWTWLLISHMCGFCLAGYHMTGMILITTTTQYPALPSKCVRYTIKKWMSDICKYPQTSEWNGFRIISDLVCWCEGNEFPKHKKDRKLSKNVAPFCEQLVKPNLYERVRKSFRNSTAVELRILCLAQSSSKVAFGCNKLFCKSILVSSLFFISALS